MKKLAYVDWGIGENDFAKFEKIWLAFRRPFPSLRGITARMIWNTALGKNPQGAVEEIQRAVDEASYDGEWPGEVFYTNDGKGWHSTRIVPYVGDRFFEIKRAWQQHWEFYAICNYEERPSDIAAQDVIELVQGAPAKWVEV
jgi:hypothetical protein